MKHTAVTPPPSDQGPKHPPRKPPDAGLKFYFGSSVAFIGASVGSLLCRMGFQLSRGKIAPMVFDGKTQKRWAFWKNLMGAGPYVADTKFYILSKFQSTSGHGFNMDNIETTYSRNVPAKAKDLIRN